MRESAVPQNHNPILHITYFSPLNPISNMPIFLHVMKIFNLCIMMLQQFTFYQHMALQSLPFHRQLSFGEHPSLPAILLSLSSCSSNRNQVLTIYPWDKFLYHNEGQKCLYYTRYVMFCAKF